MWFAFAICLIFGKAHGNDELAESFIRPPAAARPWVFWNWINGNMTREGITADLESMARVGIGGVLIFEVDLNTPKGNADFAGPVWMDLFNHACKEAKRLGLEINMNNDAGWCGSGGPWITPELSMQKVVWSETVIDGGKSLAGVLPKPQTKTDFYRDIAVLAYPSVFGDDVRMADLNPKITTNRYRFELMQTEKATDRVKPATLDIAVYEDGQAITNIERVTFDSTQDNLDSWKKSVWLSLQKRSYDKKGCYHLILRNAEDGIEVQRVEVSISIAFMDDF